MPQQMFLKISFCSIVFYRVDVDSTVIFYILYVSKIFFSENNFFFFHMRIFFIINTKTTT